jgi:hypothetical protein
MLAVLAGACGASAAEPAKAAPAGDFSVRAFGGDGVYLTDINGDGKSEMLILQTSGEPDETWVGKRGLGVEEADIALHCLTAVDLTGKVLWQDGTPWARDVPFTCHGATRNMAVAGDVDGDGKTEVVFCRGRKELVVVDGATGKRKRSVSRKGLSIYLMRAGKASAGMRIVYVGAYGGGIMYDGKDLAVVRESLPALLPGHNAVVLDADGDGRDELLYGYSLIGNDGKEIRQVDLGAAPAHEHADHIEAYDLGGDGKPEVFYSASKDFFVTDPGGKILWTSHVGHSQQSLTGPFGPNGEIRIFMAEKNAGLWGLDAAGKPLWNRKDINGYTPCRVRWSRRAGQNTWALFGPQLKPGGSLPRPSDPAQSRVLWPRFIDGDGKLHDVLPWKEEYAIPQCTIRASRSYDNGLRYGVAARDLDRDGLDEVAVFNRQHVWLFKSPE